MGFHQKFAMFPVNFWKTTSVLMAAMLVGFAGVARAEVSRQILLTTYLRDGPGASYRVVDEAQTGTKVSVMNCAEGWCDVAYGGISGYVAQSMLTSRAGQLPPLKNTACFTSREAGYHGGRDVQFCHSPGNPP